MPPIVLCSACDVVQKKASLRRRERARCVRCGAELYRAGPVSIDVPIALALTALVLLALTDSFPLVTLKLNGTSRTATLVDAALGLYQQGYAPMALLVAVTTMIVPGLEIGLLLYLLVPLRLGHRPAGFARLFRILGAIRPWGMVEVFMLGTLVALVKLSALAEIVTSTALWSCALLMFNLSALTTVTSTEHFWTWAQGADVR